MSRNKRYDPEDLETLLSTKSFSELLPEEKAFVLQYIDSDLEYDSLRETFSTLGTLPELEPEIIPRAQTKEALMAAFTQKDERVAAVSSSEEDEKKGFWAWFWNPEKSLFRKPALQLASLALVFMTGFFVLTNNSKSELAEHSNKSVPSEKSDELKDTSQDDKNNLEIKKQQIVDKAEKSHIVNVTETENSEIKSLKKEEDSKVTLDDKLNLEDLNISNNVADEFLGNTDYEDDITLNFDEISDGNTVMLTEDSNNGLVSAPDTELISEEIALEENVESLVQKEKVETTQIDTSLIEILGDDAIASDYYRTTTGNSVISPNYTISTAEATSDMDSPSVMFDLDEEVTNESAITADAFSGLLSKLYTSQ